MSQVAYPLGVQAFAFDATFAANDITGGRVQRANFGKDVKLSRSFDWVPTCTRLSRGSYQQVSSMASHVERRILADRCGPKSEWNAMS
jgi:hypothetical protein